MQLFYDPEIYNNAPIHQLSSNEAHHAIKVLRLKVGAEIFVVNGKGTIFRCSINNVEKQNCLLSIEEEQYVTPHLGEKNLHLAIAPPKNKERFEWLLEKCTELGINQITPLLCDRSERKVVPLERLQKILVSAMKQSTRSYLPKLNEITKFSEFLKTSQSDQLYIAHCENDIKQPFQNLVNNNQSLIVLIGPEGDFSPNEIRQALDKNYQPITLGSYRLRTETAGIAVCSITNFSKK